MIEERNRLAAEIARLREQRDRLLTPLRKWLMHAEANRHAYQTKDGRDVPIVRETRAALAEADDR